MDIITHVFAPTAAFVILIGLIVLLPILHSRGIIGPKKLRAGHKAKATILSIEHDGPAHSSDFVNLKLRLEVKPKGRGAYQMRAKRTVPAAQAETAFRQGQVLEVTIASEDMNQIAIQGFDPIPELA